MLKGGVEPEAVECSMCGDVGLQDKLFLCKTRDCHRHQHTYCSNWYPEERSMDAGMCNWCAATSSVKANGENMNGTSYSSTGKRGAGAAACSSGTIKGGTMGRQNNSAAVPLKIITSNNVNMSTSMCSAGGGGGGGAATAQAGAAAWPKSPPAMRTPAGRRYKLVSEM